METKKLNSKRRIKDIMETKTSNTKRRVKVVKQMNHCKYCNTFVKGNSYNFKAHLFKHNAIEGKYTCKICLKKFYRADAYKSHINRHKGVNPHKTYVCDYCERMFIVKNNLISHLKRIHDENIDSELGKFKCNVCKQCYCERRLLIQHIHRVHFNKQFSNEPLHINKSINETWIENVNNKNTQVSMTKINNNVIVIKKLKIDVKVAKRNVTKYTDASKDQYSKAMCDYCKKEMVKKSLRTHIKEVHMNIRSFKCDVCKETFFRHYQLIEHKCGSFKQKKRKTQITLDKSVKKEKDLNV